MPMGDDNSEMIHITITERIDLNDPAVMAELREKIRRPAADGAKLITLDFSSSDNLTSAIIALAFLAVKEARIYDVPIRIIASINYHRSLVAAGMTDYVDLKLCG